MFLIALLASLMVALFDIHGAARTMEDGCECDEDVAVGWWKGDLNCFVTFAGRAKVVAHVPLFVSGS